LLEHSNRSAKKAIVGPLLLGALERQKSSIKLMAMGHYPRLSRLGAIPGHPGLIVVKSHLPKIARTFAKQRGQSDGMVGRCSSHLV
jgi:hypothetical protein